MHMKFSSRNNKDRAGQAIVEALIAITVLVVGFMGIVALLSRSTGLSRVTTDNYTAAYLAAEGVEIAKNLIDAGVIRNMQWGSVLPEGAYEMDYLTDLGLNGPESYGGRPLLLDANTGRYSYDSGAVTTFRRKILVENVTPNEIRVSAIVDWTSRGNAQFSVNVEDHFFNWR
jgi:hypothetical protein